jgi:hypothetical protein
MQLGHAEGEGVEEDGKKENEDREEGKEGSSVSDRPPRPCSNVGGAATHSRFRQTLLVDGGPDQWIKYRVSIHPS